MQERGIASMKAGGIQGDCRIRVLACAPPKWTENYWPPLVRSFNAFVQETCNQRSRPFLSRLPTDHLIISVPLAARRVVRTIAVQENAKARPTDVEHGANTEKRKWLTRAKILG